MSKKANPIDSFFNSAQRKPIPVNPMIEILKNPLALGQILAAKLEVGIRDTVDGQFITMAPTPNSTLLIQDASDGRLWVELATDYSGSLIDSAFFQTVSAAIEWAIARAKEFDDELDAMN